MNDSPHGAAGARNLVWHGSLMMLLGLLSGFGPLLFPDIVGKPHLIGVVQGGMLFGLAGCWHLFAASPRTLTIAKVTLLIGLYGNWAGAQLKAFDGLVQVADIVQSTSFLPLITFALLLWASRRERSPAP